jgi:2-oxoglutarate dehydrogenase E1 component
LQKIIEKRVETVEAGEGIEWGVAEALAFGSLVLEGHSVRLSGQDCCRGTFSHRHLVLDDSEARSTFSPLVDLAEREGATGMFEVYNSSLSEASVLGFEFGYSATNRDSLVMWEGQFGDFANGAQVIIDQFITSSESKWGQLSGVVMMLPHGYEGQGPEHSSARLERYLQMCAEGNMRVCYPSTAAQYFHLMRRQGLSEIKRPLIIMTPKSLLRLPAAMSSLKEMVKGTFQPVLETDLAGKKSCKNLVFMTGKVGHDVQAALQGAEKISARLIRVEELYPFPQDEIARILKETGATNAFWVQEEPQNMGAWSYIAPLLRESLGFDPEYIGRPASAATATGSSKHHAIEQKAIISDLLARLRT